MNYHINLHLFDVLSPRKDLKLFLKTLIILILIGYIIGCISDPFIYILYFQCAFLFITIFFIKTIRKNPFILSLFIVFIIAFVSEKTKISAVLGTVLLVKLIERNLINSFLWRRVFIFSSTVIIATISFLFLYHASPYSHPLHDQSSNYESIQSLPYVSSVNDEKNKVKEGVVEYNQKLCAPGINLYNSYYKPGAYLLDMSGNKLHEWLPQGLRSEWQCVTACENGDLLICIEDAMLMRLNWDSHILWQKKMRTHHDIAVAENKDICTLISAEELVSIFFLQVPIINDYIVIMSADGTIKKKISLFNLLKKKIPLANILKIYYQMIYPKDFLWRVIKQKLNNHFLLRRMTPFDVFHNNTITPIDKTIEGICNKGDILICAND